MGGVHEFFVERKELATPLIRIGLALVLLWFGIEQLRNQDLWIGYIPPWAFDAIPLQPATFVLFNGIFDFSMGALLLAGFYTRAIAALTALHLLGIIFSVGSNEIAARDFGLMMAAISLVFSGAGKWSWDEKIK